ncbi:MAG: CsbD family protein [Pseudoalteromonas distincta]
MSSTTDKIKGTANEIVGKGKQAVGNSVGNERLQGEGAAQEVKGKAQNLKGDVKNVIKDGIDKT